MAVLNPCRSKIYASSFEGYRQRGTGRWPKPRPNGMAELRSRPLPNKPGGSCAFFCTRRERTCPFRLSTPMPRAAHLLAGNEAPPLMKRSWETIRLRAFIDTCRVGPFYLSVYFSHPAGSSLWGIFISNTFKSPGSHKSSVGSSVYHRSGNTALI